MKDYNDRRLSPINNDIKTPILIVGGGIAGLMCAYQMMKKNITFILVDAGKLASGVSAYTTAQVSVAHDALYNEIQKKHDKEHAITYLKLQLEGLDLVKKIIKEENIECDYKEESTVLYAKEENNIKTLNDQYRLLKAQTNIQLSDLQKDVFHYKQGLEFKHQFIFNPMKYMMGIIDVLIKHNIPLYENSRVTEITKKNNGYEVIINDKYKITTPKIVMACHYPIIVPDHLYFAKIYQSKSYVIAFQSKLKLNANYVSLDEPYYYFRTYDESTLLIGGSDHFTGSDTNIENHYEELTKKIYKLDKEAKILYKWSTEDCMPIDSLPFVGEYNKDNPNILLITGFQKWGFTNSHIAAQMVTSMLQKKQYNRLFRTDRYTLLKDFKSTLRMIGHSLDGLITSKLCIKDYKLEDIKIGSGKVTNFKGKNVLVYRENEVEYIFLKDKCTHMGCSLIWNDVEKLWECKCHGSMFDRYGKIVYGPALENLERLYY